MVGVQKNPEGLASGSIDVVDVSATADDAHAVAELPRVTIQRIRFQSLMADRHDAGRCLSDPHMHHGGIDHATPVQLLCLLDLRHAFFEGHVISPRFPGVSPVNF